MKAVFVLVVLTCTVASARKLAQDSVEASSSAFSAGEPSSSSSIAVSGIFSVAKNIDVYILADTTGSMGGEIAQVQADASALVSSIFALSSINGGARVGVGQYRDEGDAFIFDNQLSLQTDPQAAINAINSWVASGGGDFREGQFFALEQIANSAVGFTSNNAIRIVVWFGDAPGQLFPVAGSDEASATAALVTAGIRVLAIDVGSLNLDGQASRIAAATGGIFLTADGVPAPGTTTVSADSGGGSTSEASATGQLRIVSAASGGDSDMAVESGGTTLPDAIRAGVQGIVLTHADR